MQSALEKMTVMQSAPEKMTVMQSALGKMTVYYKLPVSTENAGNEHSPVYYLVYIVNYMLNVVKCILYLVNFMNYVVYGMMLTFCCT